MKLNDFLLIFSFTISVMLLNVQTNCGHLIQNPGFDWNGGGNETPTGSDANFDGVSHKIVLNGVDAGHCNNWQKLADTPDILTESGVGGSSCMSLQTK
jgi:hypothetical protein